MYCHRRDASERASLRERPSSGKRRPRKMAGRLPPAGATPCGVPERASRRTPARTRRGCPAGTFGRGPCRRRGSTSSSSPPRPRAAQGSAPAADSSRSGRASQCRRCHTGRASAWRGCAAVRGETSRPGRGLAFFCQRAAARPTRAGERSTEARRIMQRARAPPPRPEESRGLGALHAPAAEARARPAHRMSRRHAHRRRERAPSQSSPPDYPLPA